MKTGFGIFRSPFGRASLYLLGLAALLALALLAYLQLGPKRDVYDASHVFVPCLYVPAGGGEHRAKPDCRGVSQVGERKAEMRFNSLGLRDREYNAQPSPGVFRILLLGSSNVLGPGIEERATFARRLEQALVSAGRKAEVINAGMVGYCTAQSSFRLRELLERYSPHLVLYQFVQGTCPLFDGAWAGRVELEAGEPKRIDRAPFAKEGPFSFLNRPVFARPVLFFFWLTLADQLRKVSFSRAYSAGADQDSRARIYLEPTLSFLSYMRAAAKEKGATFVVFSYRMKPFTQTVPSHYYKWVVRLLSPLVKPIDFSHDRIFGGLENGGFRYVYPEPATKDLLMDGDMHLSEDGLLLLAREAATGLLPYLPGTRARSTRSRE